MGGQHRLDLGAERGVALTGGVEEGVALLGWDLERVEEHLLQPAPRFGIHVPSSLRVEVPRGP
jgi:hypothetical protein